MPCNMPVRETMCATCPFRAGSKYAHLVPGIALSALAVARICHSTGANNSINKRTGKKPHICRGARDLQLCRMARLGVIDRPTDEAWNEQRVKIGMKPIVAKDPA